MFLWFVMGLNGATKRSLYNDLNYTGNLRETLYSCGSTMRCTIFETGAICIFGFECFVSCKRRYDAYSGNLYTMCVFVNTYVDFLTPQTVSAYKEHMRVQQMSGYTISSSK